MCNSKIIDIVHHPTVWLNFISSSVLTVGLCISIVKTGYHRDAVVLRRKKITVACCHLRFTEKVTNMDTSQSKK